MMWEATLSNQNNSTLNRFLQPLWVWAQRHPGTVVVGALLVAALLAGPAVRKSPPQVDPGEAGDVPLFI